MYLFCISCKKIVAIIKGPTLVYYVNVTLISSEEELKMKLQLCVDIKCLYLRSRSSTDLELGNSYKSYCTNVTKLLQKLNKTWCKKQISASYNKTKTIWHFIETATKRNGKTGFFFHHC